MFVIDFQIIIEVYVPIAAHARYFLKALHFSFVARAMNAKQIVAQRVRWFQINLLAARCERTGQYDERLLAITARTNFALIVRISVHQKLVTLRTLNSTNYHTTAFIRTPYVETIYICFRRKKY